VVRRGCRLIHRGPGSCPPWTAADQATDLQFGEGDSGIRAGIRCSACTPAATWSATKNRTPLARAWGQCTRGEYYSLYPHYMLGTIADRNHTVVRDLSGLTPLG
jgi:hypothetical protein